MASEKNKHNKPLEDLRSKKIIWTIDSPDINSDAEAELGSVTDKDVFPEDTFTLLNSAHQESFENE